MEGFVKTSRTDAVEGEKKLTEGWSWASVEQLQVQQLKQTMYEYATNVLANHSQMNGTELNVAAEICRLLINDPVA
jgi:hypothetical protein